MFLESAQVPYRHGREDENAYKARCLNLGLLEEHPRLLTAEPTLPPVPLGPFFKLDPRKSYGRPMGVKVWGIGIGA